MAEVPPGPAPGYLRGSENSPEIRALIENQFTQFQTQIAALTQIITQQNVPSTSGLQVRGQPSARGRGRSAVRGSTRGSRSSQGARSVRARSGSVRGSRAASRSQYSSVSRAARERMNDFINQASPSDLFTDDLSSIPSLSANKKIIYIKKLDCQINSRSLDQLDDKSDEDQTMQQYFRMSYFTGQLNSLFSNGITYDDFKNGYFFAVYDLSTSGRGAGSAFLSPSVRVGHLRLR